MSYWDHRRPVRRSRAVDEQAIARACVDLLDEGGLRALTLRAIAGRLGVAPSSLYTRVDSVDDLFDLALDAALGDDADMDRAMVEEPLEGFLLSYYRHLLRHRWAIQVIAMRPPRGAHYLRLSERLVVLLVESGAENSLSSAYALSNFVIGSAATAPVASDEQSTPVDPALAPTYARLHDLSQAGDAEHTVIAGIAALASAA